MPKKIVVVDDEPDILTVVVFRLKKLGHQVLTAITGNDALALIRAEKPDLILLDYRLPDMNGLEISKILRAEEAYKSTPIIMLTASSGGDLGREAAAAAVNEYIKKPFDPEELLACVNKYL
jgi:two-component system, OmpR family, alkaline phosphatase synthesis response regulator PhoP